MIRAKITVAWIVAVLVGGFLIQSLIGFDGELAALTVVLPWLELAAATVLAWRFARSRLLVVSVCLVLGDLALSYQGPEAELWQLLVAVLLPLNLAALGIVRDRPVSHQASVAHLGLIAGQVLLLAHLLGLLGPLPNAAAPFQAAIPGLSTDAIQLFVVLLLTTIFGISAALRRSAFDLGLVGTIPAVLLALHSPSPEAASWWMAMAQLVVLICFVETAYRLAFHDDLTGLPGRRALNEALKNLDGDYAVAMVDVDHFKKFNDRHGHDAGDQVLRMVAVRLAEIAPTGRAYRYGGEEFTVLFPTMAPRDAEPHVELLREAIASIPFGLRDQKSRSDSSKRGSAGTSNRGAKVTASFGLAGPSARRRDPDEVIKAADKALYKAKRAGRNRVVRV